MDDVLYQVRLFCELIILNASRSHVFIAILEAFDYKSLRAGYVPWFSQARTTASSRVLADQPIVDVDGQSRTIVDSDISSKQMG